jgi:hypothetical protein
MRRFAAFCFIVSGVVAGCAVGSNEPANPGDPIVGVSAATDASLSQDAQPLQGNIDATAPEAAVDASAAEDVQDSGAPDAALDAPAEASTSCPGYAVPSTPAACNACASGSQTCDPNGCFNGYYCRLSDAKCIKKPVSCP